MGTKTWRKSHLLKQPLLQHSKRAAHPAGVWTTSEMTKQDRPTPKEWDWSWDNEILSWIPVWTTLPLASQVCAELIKCGAILRLVVVPDVDVKRLTGHVLNSVVVPV